MSNDQYYGGQPYDPYANGNGNGQQSQQGADVTQTWEGQTWDTQYQPAVTYEQVQAARAQPPVSYGGQEAAYQQEQQPYPPYAPEQDSYGSHGSYGNGAPAAYYAEPQPHSAEAPAPEPAPAPVPAPAAEAGPAYSSPTTSGNTRITDAQRARAEGRSPIIDPGMRPAALTAVLGLLLAGGAALGSYGLLVPLVLLQGLTAAGWFRLNGMWPARQVPGAPCYVADQLHQRILAGPHGVGVVPRRLAE